MNWKPIAASLAVIVLALGAMAAFGSRKSGDKPDDPPQTPPANTPDESDERRWERGTLEPRQIADPLSLWPGNEMRLASPRFWIIWETPNAPTQCTLLIRSPHGTWHEAAHSFAYIHYHQQDLSLHDDDLLFCVEWSDHGREYRSQERRVSFGRGAAFARREYRVAVPKQGEVRLSMRLEGAEQAQLSSGSFTSFVFPEDLVTYVYVPQPFTGEVTFGVHNPEAIPDGGCYGFLQVYDGATHTYDRVRIALRPA
jgi:hypothetical protein